VLKQSVTANIVWETELQLDPENTIDTPQAKAARMEQLRVYANREFNAAAAGKMNTAISNALGAAGGTLEADEVPAFLAQVEEAFVLSVGRGLNDKEQKAVRDYATSAVKSGRGTDLRTKELFDDIIQGRQAGLSEETLAPMIQEHWELSGKEGAYTPGYMDAPAIDPEATARLALQAQREARQAANAERRLAELERGNIKLSTLYSQDGQVYDDFEKLRQEAAGEMRKGPDGNYAYLKPPVTRMLDIESGLERLQKKGGRLDSQMQRIDPEARSSIRLEEGDVTHSRQTADRVAKMGRNPKWTGTTAAAALREGGANEAEVSYYMNTFFWPSKPKPKKELSLFQKVTGVNPE
jgi:hypothetical protein